MNTSLVCQELLKLIEYQAELIVKLTNENIEQENLINTLMNEF
jgi:hypothetical protein